MQNPYHLSHISEPVGFCGRQDILRFVNTVLSGPHNNLVVLYGQRRIGKTSLLLQLAHPSHTPPGFHPVFFSLRGQAQRKLGEVLYTLSRAINRELVRELQVAQFANPRVEFREIFLPRLYEKLPEDQRLLLLLDEFDDLCEEPRIWGEDVAAVALIPYLEDLLRGETRLAVVAVVGQRPDILPSWIKACFKQAPVRGISLLEEDEARQLITKPVQGFLSYDEAAVALILSLTAGHPFITQLICYELFERLRDRPDRQVRSSDVEAVIERAMETGSGGLAWYWDGFRIEERFILSAIAEVSDEQGVATQERIHAVLHQEGIRLQGAELIDAPQELIHWDILRPDGNGYRFAVEFIRRWIRTHHPLAQAKRELKEISPRATSLYRAANRAHKDGDLLEAVRLYREALVVNPNLFDAQLGLAQALREQRLFDDAVAAYERAYELEPELSRDGLLDALRDSARQLEQRERMEEALARDDRILELVPQDEEARRRSAKIWSKRGNGHRDDDHFPEALDAYRRAWALTPTDDELIRKISKVEEDRQRIEERRLHEEEARRTLAEGHLQNALHVQTKSREETMRRARRLTGLAIALVVLVGLLPGPPDLGARFVMTFLLLGVLLVMHFVSFEWAPATTVVLGYLEIRDPRGKLRKVNLGQKEQQVVTIGRDGDVVLDQDTNLPLVAAEIWSKANRRGEVSWWLWRLEGGRRDTLDRWLWEYYGRSWGRVLGRLLGRDQMHTVPPEQLYDNTQFSIGRYQFTYCNLDAQKEETSDQG